MLASQTIQSGLKEAVLSLDAERVEAMIKRDTAALNKLLADELSYVHSGGRSDSKQSFIDFIASPASNYLAVDYSYTEVIECGIAAVLIRGIARLHLGVRTDLAEELYSVFFSDVWVARDEGWQMVAWNATRVPD
jgi:hypothetical protein